MNLSNESELWKSALIVYYDLEFSGNIRLDFGKQCSIHEIAAQSKNDRFFCRVNPYATKEVVEPPVDPKYHMPSQQELEQMQALTFPTAYDQFVSFIYRLLLKRKKKWVCLVSHNGFRGDKIVFEHEIVYHHLPPVPFFFFDSLLYLREVNPGLPSYSLPNIYGELFHSVYKAHSAYTDTEALQKIVKHIGQPLHGVLYPMHTIPWRNVGGVGYHTEQTFLQHRLPDLTALFRLCRGNQQVTEHFLKQRGIVLTDKTLGNLFHWYKLCVTIVGRQSHALLHAPPAMPC
tara:strand:+ start:416 stop:1279 length:864 start_codon:yes stop_codon:yes gene_type:complete